MSQVLVYQASLAARLAGLESCGAAAVLTEARRGSEDPLKAAQRFQLQQIPPEPEERGWWEDWLLDNPVTSPLSNVANGTAMNMVCLDSVKGQDGQSDRAPLLSALD